MTQVVRTATERQTISKARRLLVLTDGSCWFFFTFGMTSLYIKQRIEVFLLRGVLHIDLAIWTMSARAPAAFPSLKVSILCEHLVSTGGVDVHLLLCLTRLSVGSVNGHLLLRGLTSSPSLPGPPVAAGAANAPGVGGADPRPAPARTSTVELWHGHRDRSAIESAEADESADNRRARVVLLEHAPVTRLRV